MHSDNNNNINLNVTTIMKNVNTLFLGEIIIKIIKFPILKNDPYILLI